jgi:hypothetical protein
MQKGMQHTPLLRTTWSNIEKVLNIESLLSHLYVVL